MASGGPSPPPLEHFRVLTVKPAKWYRVHRASFAPDQFNDTAKGNARFSPLRNPATDEVIPTIYAASSARGAIAEIILHDVPRPSTGHLHDWERDKALGYRLSSVDLDALSLVNLTSTGLRAAGLAWDDLFAGDAPDYPRTRTWAQHIWQSVPSAQGLLWMSVRDNTIEVCMLFGDRVPSGAIKDAGDSKPIVAFEQTVFELLDELGCGLALP